MEEIIEYVAHHIESSGYYDKLGAGIVITGGGALLKNIAHLIRLKTGLDVRLGQPDRFLNNDLVDEGEMPLFSTSVGLLVSSSLYATQRVVEQKLFESTEEEQLSHNEAASRKVVTKQKAGRSRMAKEASYITGDLFGNIKNKIAGIFDDRDVEM
jgi:cell division protein FtsA